MDDKYFKDILDYGIFSNNSNKIISFFSKRFSKVRKRNNPTYISGYFLFQQKYNQVFLSFSTGYLFLMSLIVFIHNIRQYDLPMSKNLSIYFMLGAMIIFLYSIKTKQQIVAKIENFKESIRQKKHLNP